MTTPILQQVVQQVVAGIATGSIYACIGLAIVMIHQAIDHVNFAQGEMAMFSTYLAWQGLQWGWPFRSPSSPRCSPRWRSAWRSTGWCSGRCTPRRR